MFALSACPSLHAVALTHAIAASGIHMRCIRKGCSGHQQFTENQWDIRLPYCQDARKPLEQFYQ